MITVSREDIDLDLDMVITEMMIDNANKPLGEYKDIPSLIAEHVEKYYISKADHEVELRSVRIEMFKDSDLALKSVHESEMQGLELEIKLLKDDEVCMKKKLKENVMKARVEVANKAMQALDRIDPTDSSKQILMEKVRIGEIISDNERIPEVSKTIDEN